ncbi:MAG TPA: DUF4157 domain-containing protein [Anaerolineae bacterium]|nr:DUF4157 domain-containing protein [Anaerolineae bacterium]
MLLRSCACGATPGPTGDCAACRRGHGPGGVVQAKLRVSQPGDPFEREADRVAEQVMRMPEPGVQRQIDEEDKEELLQTKPLVQRRVASTGDGSDTPRVVHEALRVPGRPLDPGTRAFMQSRLGHDLSRVRVHTDARAAESARAVNARAYTVGRDVVFGRGQYAPETGAGKRLLAHELTHVLQQWGDGHTEGGTAPQGVIQRDLARVEDLLKERFVDPEDPRLAGRRQSLAFEIRVLSPADARVLLDRIMRPTGEDVVAESFQRLSRSVRRELLLSLFERMGHLEAERVYADLTGDATTEREKQLQARFQQVARGRKTREELLERLRSRFAPAHQAPTGAAAPWVNLRDENMRTSGSISADNQCKVCSGPEFQSLGVDLSAARNAMELRGDVSGHRPGARYDFKRTRESGTWVGNGAWRQIEYDAPGTDDDTLGNSDEDLTPDPRLNHIYSVDAPGFSSLDPTDVHPLPRGTSEYVRKHSFEEWVVVKVGAGSWTRASDVLSWHSSVWLEKVNGRWQRKTGAMNQVAPGPIPVGKQDMPF